VQRAAFVLLLCTIGLTWRGAAQKPAPPQAVFRSSVDLVHLDVSVLDKNRRPIRGLTAADFTILEDGQPRAITAFAELHVPAPKPPASPDSWVTRVAADVQTNDIARTPEGRLLVLLLDDAMIPRDPAIVSTARKIAETAVDRMSPADQMAVVFTAGSRGAQNFTGDRAKLLQAVGTFQPGYANHVMGWDTATWNEEKKTWERSVDTDDGYRHGSLRTLESVANSLIAAPQRRKVILFVSTGLFADSGGVAEVRLARPGESQQMREGNATLVGRLPDLYRRMREANVTIYSLDPAGLGGMEQHVMRVASRIHALVQSGRPMSLLDDWYAAGAVPVPTDLARKVGTVNLDFLKSAAANTGGLAITETNDLSAGVNRIFDENESYYLLGFSLPPGHRAGSRHRLEVKVSRTDVTVRTRSGYAAPEPSAAEPEPGSPAKPAPSPATTALAGPVPAGALPMRVSLAPFAAAAGGTGHPVVAIALGLDHPVPAKTSQAFDVELRAFSPDGSGKLSERRTGQAVLRPPEPGGDSVFDLLARIDLPPGRYELRFGAHLSPANLAGSLFADLEVPDFAKSPVSLSGIVMDAGSDANAGPLDALAAVMPVVPTSRRSFTGRDAPVAFVRVYQGGDSALTAVSMRVTVHDRANELTFNNRFPLPVARFDPKTRAADFRFNVPVGALRTGPYLITLEAVRGTDTARRQVRFTYR
jgi:VWFA-related protein